MAEVAEAVLELNATGRQTRQVEPITTGEAHVTKGRLDQTIDPASAFMLTVG